ncbi:hypothetical protein SAMN05880574_1514, partial [Chryseobacterium sp. RU37D]
VTNGVISFWTGVANSNTNERMRIHSNGNVGIGTATPSNKLDLGTTAGATITDPAGKKFAVYNNTTGTDFYGLGVSPGVLQFHASSQTVNDAPGMALYGKKLGINLGTTAPAANLDVAGNVKIADGTQGLGKILVSDANGLASWQDAITASNNIYNSNGTLTTNRTVTQAAHPITFTGGDFNVIPASSGTGLTITGSSTHPVTSSPRIFSQEGLEIQSNNNQGLVMVNGVYPLVATNPVFRVMYSNTSNAPNQIEYLRVQANGSVGIGTTTPNTNASLDLGTNNQAFMTNRVANTAAIATPAEGMFIYVNDQKCFKGYSNSSWHDMTPCSSVGTLSLNCPGVSPSTITNYGSGVITFIYLPYTGGSGGPLTPFSVSSQGVTGMALSTTTSVIPAGNGSLILALTGTPSSHPGTASFPINVNGVTCTVNLFIQ